MSNFKIYTMTERVLKTLKTRGNSKTTCYTCSKSLKIGQKVVSVSKINGRKIRHVECAKRIGML
jgi:hypothetical protein